MSNTTQTHAPNTVLSSRRRWAALAVLALAVLVLAIDATVLYLAVPALTRDLAPSATQILWIGDVYSLAIAGLLIVMGNVADRIGRKRLLLIGAVGFGAASLLAAFSTSPEMLIGARLLLGVAGATLMPSTLSLIRNIFADPTERTRAIAVWSAAAAGGAAVGPLVGGILLEHFAWGSVFLVNVPVMVLLVVSGAFLLPESRNPEPGPFDLPSAALSMGAIVPIVYAVKHMASEGLDAVGPLWLVVGLVLGVVFVLRQRRLEAPLIDVDLFRSPAFSGAVLASFLAIFALTGLMYFFSQYLQLARGFRPLHAGLAELPSTLASIGVVVIVGVVVTRLGRGRTIAGGLLLISVGLVCIAIAESASSYLWLALALVPVGLGAGLAQTVTTDAVVSAVPARKAGAASAVAETAYELGTVFGIALLGSLVTVVYRSSLALPAGFAPDVEETVRESLALASNALAPGSEALVAAQEAFTTAMQTTSLVAAAIVLLGAVVAWWAIPSDADADAAPTAADAAPADVDAHAV